MLNGSFSIYLFYSPNLDLEALKFAKISDPLSATLYIRACAILPCRYSFPAVFEICISLEVTLCPTGVSDPAKTPFTHILLVVPSYLATALNHPFVGETEIFTDNHYPTNNLVVD